MYKLNILKFSLFIIFFINASAKKLPIESDNDIEIKKNAIHSKYIE